MRSSYIIEKLIFNLVIVDSLKIIFVFKIINEIKNSTSIIFRIQNAYVPALKLESTALAALGVLAGGGAEG